MTGSGGPIAVIGGGWAGLACAVELSDAGMHVVVHEAAAVLGGRARRVDHGPLSIDNGQHLLLGAYRETLAMIHRVQTDAAASDLYVRTPLLLAGPGAFRMRAPRWPAPLHTLAALLTARDSSWTERLAVLAAFRRWQSRGWRCHAATTVAGLLIGQPARMVARLWAPLCLAALNTTPETASGAVFLNVLRDAFGGRGSDSDLVIPAVDLSQLFPEPAAAWIEARGGRIRRRTNVRRIVRRDGRLQLEAADHSVSCDPFSAVVVATAPSQAISLLAALPDTRATRTLLESYRFEPITTVYLELAGRIAPTDPLRQLQGSPGQWLFDRTGRHGRTRLAIVISADGGSRRLAHDALIAAVLAQLRAQFDDPPFYEPPAWARVISERRATHASVPLRAHPTAGAISAGIFLAGDHTDGEYPATLEAAVRSGIRAATAILGRR